MISHINIRDFAIIDELDLELHPGLNVITGETGAGKSIVIEAISAALGSRADTTFVRTGKEKAYITLAVDRKDCRVDELLSENGIPDDDPLIIRREISSAGKSVCRVNGEVVPLSFLAKLCKKIADIHGQYDHQSLLSPEAHIHLLDLYAAEKIMPQKSEVAEYYKRYSAAERELSALRRSLSDSARKRDFMAFELQEIRKARLVPGEDAELAADIRIMQNSEHIYANVSEAYSLLSAASPSVAELLGKAQRLLAEIADFSPEISDFTETVSDCYYRLEDTAAELRRTCDTVSFSPADLENAVSRLDLIDSLKRKYGSTVEQILQYADKTERELSMIENADAHLEELTKQAETAKQQLTDASRKLSALRREAAAEMAAQITEELKELNFNDAVLQVEFRELAPGTFSENGIDLVEFLIAANKGEPPKPLIKIASGGEISRIMLAFKRITCDLDRIPTMIFDEIDSGISGITASIVGQKMRQIAKGHQVICITHLPQIAAFGQHHYRIQKYTDDTAAHTTVVPLDEREKVEEIARLLGGINITETTKKSAEELLRLSEGSV